MEFLPDAHHTTGHANGQSPVFHTHSICLPWPPKELSPNFRTRRTSWVARVRKQYRATCANVAWDRGIRPTNGGAIARVIFHPPTRNTPDKDNAIARFKAGQDGIADALGSDDATFDPEYIIGTPVKRGAVVVIMRIPD